MTPNARRDPGRGLSWDGGGSRRLAAVLALALAVVAAAPATTDGETPAASAWAGAGWQDASTIGTYDPKSFDGSMNSVTEQIGARSYWQAGYNGSGVDVALIDTGIAPVEGLTGAGQVVNGPDLSFEAGRADLRHVDGYGHGTHLAGIIAGRDPGTPQFPSSKDTQIHFVGVAPAARIVNVRVGDRAGAVDVTQVIAAIDWVVEHKNSGDLDIRVLALAYGTDSTQSPSVDPLSHAVERAWKAGIVVVAAAGNDGNAAPLRNPATNPYVISVGALDGLRTKGAAAQPIPDFSPCGGSRTVDLIAPGGSIVSLRAPGSYADQTSPEARVSSRFFLGSGTSQAAAVVAGAAALVIDEHPNATPDQVKAVLTRSADPIRKVPSSCQGSGVLDLWSARSVFPSGSQRHEASKGSGSLEESRGNIHVQRHGVVLEGEIDIFGQRFDSAEWASAGQTWVGGTWNGTEWTGVSWSGLSWSGVSWSGVSWSGVSWSGVSWSGVSWSGVSWSGVSWSGGTWSAGTWS